MEIKNKPCKTDRRAWHVQLSGNNEINLQKGNECEGCHSYWLLLHMNSMPDTVGDVLYKMAYLITPQSCEVVTDFITMLKWGNQNQDIEELLELLKCGKARLTSEPIILTKAQYLLSWSPLLVPCISNSHSTHCGGTPQIGYQPCLLALLSHWFWTCHAFLRYPTFVCHLYFSYSTGHPHHLTWSPGSGPACRRVMALKIRFQDQHCQRFLRVC